jgi:hypothetical protein
MADMMIKILQEIRDELKETNSRLERVERRQTEADVRLATELTAVVGAIGDLKSVLVDDRKLRSTVANHEQRLKALEKRKAS